MRSTTSMSVAVAVVVLCVVVSASADVTHSSAPTTTTSDPHLATTTPATITHDHTTTTTTTSDPPTTSTTNHDHPTTIHDHPTTDNQEPHRTKDNLLDSSLSRLTTYSRRGLEERKEGRSTSISEMSRNLVLIAGVCLERINGFKDEFVEDRLGYTWSQADVLYPPGSLPAPYLPDLPTFYAPTDFTTDLVLAYGLMQHYLVGMEHLTLDQVLYYQDDFMESIDDINGNLDTLLAYSRLYMEQLGVEPDDAVTQSLTNVTYTSEPSKKRGERDFVILRDFRAALQLFRDTFTIYQRARLTRT